MADGEDAKEPLMARGPSCSLTRNPFAFCTLLFAEFAFQALLPDEGFEGQVCTAVLTINPAYVSQPIPLAPLPLVLPGRLHST